MSFSEKFQPRQNQTIQPRKGPDFAEPPKAAVFYVLALVRNWISVRPPSTDTNRAPSCFRVLWGFSTPYFKFQSKMKNIPKAAEGCSCSSTFWSWGSAGSSRLFLY